MPIDLSPHPFVATVARELDATNQLQGPRARAGRAYQALEYNAAQGSTGEAPADPALKGNFHEQTTLENFPDQRPLDQDELKAVRQLAGARDVPELITFSGYLGATIARQSEAGVPEWTVLYQDSRLWSWLLVETNGIVYRRAVQDDRSPFGSRDVVWVRANATVGRGSDAVSIESQFLTGSFMSAGDCEEPPGGGTLSASTGVFCEARSPGCCRKTPG